MKIDNRSDVLLRGYYYHIYNNCNNSERMFFEERNYAYFLSKFKKHMNEFVKVYSYSLLPDHFHFLLYIKELDIKTDQGNRRTVSQAFSNFFNSYTKSVNIQEERSGNLFNRPFKRILINNVDYMKDLICYINKNPMHHNPGIDYRKYMWSSYRDVVEQRIGLTETDEVLTLYSGLDNFKDSHIASSDKLIYEFEI